MMLSILLGQGFTAEPQRKPAAFCPAGRLAPLLILAGLLILPTATRAAEADAKTARILALVNQARAEAKLAPLAAEPRLTAAACRHARDLAGGGPLSHRGSDGSDLADRLTASGYPFAMAAENLAAGVPTPEENVWLWLGSPGHRRNIMTAEFREAGIANMAASDVWVLVLAVPRPQDRRPPGEQPKTAATCG